MGSGKAERASSNNKEKTAAAPSLKNPKIKPRASNFKKKKNDDKQKQNTHKNAVDNNTTNTENVEVVPAASASQQLSFFIDEYQSANGVQLSSIELESIQERCFVDVSEELSKDVKSLGKLIKAAFGQSWKQELCEGQLQGGKIEPGSPSVLMITTSALRSIELLRGVHALTRECRAVKLFSKHMKIEEQVALLKNRVNIASGTPSRVKKLIDIEALGLSRLTMIILDIHKDVKGYSLLTLPQVRDEFWDLYKNYFHQKLVQGDLRICLFGPVSFGNGLKGKKTNRVLDE